MLKHQLEAIMIGGIVAAGYLNAAVHIEDRFGIIEHGRGAEPYADDIRAGILKALHDRPFQRRGTEAPVIADRDP